MTARHPYPVSGPVVARITVPSGRRDGHRVLRHEVRGVPHAVAHVHDPPGQVDALVDEPEPLPPSPHLVEHPPRHRHGALPHECHVAGTPAFRPAGMPMSVSRPRPCTDSGSPSGCQPLPTTTTSTSTPSCRSSES